VAAVKVTTSVSLLDTVIPTLGTSPKVENWPMKLLGASGLNLGEPRSGSRWLLSPPLDGADSTQACI
jgi:hypothetical protein